MKMTRTFPKKTTRGLDEMIESANESMAEDPYPSAREEPEAEGKIGNYQEQLRELGETDDEGEVGRRDNAIRDGGKIPKVAKTNRKRRRADEQDESQDINADEERIAHKRAKKERRHSVKKRKQHEAESADVEMVDAHDRPTVEDESIVRNGSTEQVADADDVEEARKKAKKERKRLQKLEKEWAAKEKQATAAQPETDGHAMDAHEDPSTVPISPEPISGVRKATESDPTPDQDDKEARKKAKRERKRQEKLEKARVAREEAEQQQRNDDTPSAPSDPFVSAPQSPIHNGPPDSQIVIPESSQMSQALAQLSASQMDETPTPDAQKRKGAKKSKKEAVSAPAEPENLLSKEISTFTEHAVADTAEAEKQRKKEEKKRRKEVKQRNDKERQAQAGTEEAQAAPSQVTERQNTENQATESQRSYTLEAQATPAPARTPKPRRKDAQKDTPSKVTENHVTEGQRSNTFETPPPPVSARKSKPGKKDAPKNTPSQATESQHAENQATESQRSKSFEATVPPAPARTPKPSKKDPLKNTPSQATESQRSNTLEATGPLCTSANTQAQQKGPSKEHSKPDH